MRYFAMIDGERRGPIELDGLAEAGVRPDTYVWCKGMADWEKAEDVADICRYYRRRIFDLMHPSRRRESTDKSAGSDESAEPAGEDPYAVLPPRFRELARRAGTPPRGIRDDSPDTSVPPSPTLFLSILLTLFCFPLTGLVAVFYSYKARVAWTESQRSRSRNDKDLYSDSEREQLRADAHDYDRSAKMWAGITFFLGLILYAFMGHKFF